ncbi:hypothetical protein B0T26DRAFT_781052 [Lasiosphaeria miniovina]|uniref:HNH domain-containing protein n=1 Tax=Lasiosphaeria miniovina TaxID=1954250 RepID=A0AA40AC71_9PEZI|nr:uncharacterized protein B0T26DRAFT_781052 [Lasiosphaeria miniovina]KAK0713035.1 hypothetical protein B0T26DRAFT_781052 [Lasiosphaeria miniovina]
MAHQSYHGTAADNYEQFRDILSSALIEQLAQPGPRRSRRQQRQRQRQRAKKPAGSPSPSFLATAREKSTGPPEAIADADAVDDDLTDFVEYIASAIFAALPAELQEIDYGAWAADKPSSPLQQRYALPLSSDAVGDMLRLTTSGGVDASISESLAAYGVTTNTSGVEPEPEPETGMAELLAPVVTAYISSATAAPAPASATKGLVTGCELCGRDWINLTYHHLIPRMVHAKVVKRGWHRADELQNVAWLCGACHRFVHRFAGHEDLARRFYTVELLLEQPAVAAFAEWAGRLRWKGLGEARRRRGP